MAAPDDNHDQLEQLCENICSFALNSIYHGITRALKLMGTAFSKAARSRLLFPDTEGWPLDVGSDDEDDTGGSRRARNTSEQQHRTAVGIPVAGGVDDINSVDALGLSAIVCVMALSIAATGSMTAAIVAVPFSVAVIIGCYTVAIRHTARAHASMYIAQNSAHTNALTKRHGELITTFGKLLERIGNEHTDDERCDVCNKIASMLQDARRTGRPQPTPMDIPEPIELPPRILGGEEWTRYAAQASTNQQYHDAIAHAAQQASSRAESGLPSPRQRPTNSPPRQGVPEE